eukprot:13700095-Alexandrium_andersonii.AAC.1
MPPLGTDPLDVSCLPRIACSAGFRSRGTDARLSSEEVEGSARPGKLCRPDPEGKVQPFALRRACCRRCGE